MGSCGSFSQLKQIAVEASREGKPVIADDLSPDRKQEEESVFASVFTKPHPHVGPEWSDADRVSPYPLLLPEYFVENAKQLQEALAIAVTSIVERWAEPGEGDGDSLSQRMPMQHHEDALLRWIHEKTKEGVIPPYSERMGHWRPDILLSNTDNGDLSFRMCEINARFFQNSLLYSMQALTACSRMLSDHPVFQPTADPEELLDCLCGLFDPSLPLHLLVDWGKPKMAVAITELLKKRAGVSAKVISASDLCLIPDDTSPTGHSLYAVCTKSDRAATHVQNSASEITERVHQVGLYFFQDEFRNLSAEILQHIAICCVNDIRTIFLVADKRILEVVLQELDSLVNKYKLLTPEQARILRDGIVPTVLPGSPELDTLISQSRTNQALKDEYIIKPTRDAGSVGILFGDELRDDEWQRLLADMQDPRVYPHQFQYIIQPVVRQPAIRMSDQTEWTTGDQNAVGLYYAFHGRYKALGAWRVTEGRLSAYAKGGFRIPSVIMK